MFISLSSIIVKITRTRKFLYIHYCRVENARPPKGAHHTRIPFPEHVFKWAVQLETLGLTKLDVQLALLRDSADGLYIKRTSLGVLPKAQRFKFLAGLSISQKNVSS